MIFTTEDQVRDFIHQLKGVRPASAQQFSAIIEPESHYYPEADLMLIDIRTDAIDSSSLSFRLQDGTYLECPVTGSENIYHMLCTSIESSHTEGTIEIISGSWKIIM